MMKDVRGFSLLLAYTFGEIRFPVLQRARIGKKLHILQPFTSFSSFSEFGFFVVIQ
jgi:hypothetical protein